MNPFEQYNIAENRIQRYAHTKAWMQDLHPPYRYHLDNIDIAPVLGLGWESPWSIWNQIRSQQLNPPTLQQTNKQRVENWNVTRSQATCRTLENH